MFSWRNNKNIMWIPPLIRNYDLRQKYDVYIVILSAPEC